ncbi:MAG: DUF433 domain-containing protein [Armatimonadetes bacterium]|nr:DUF433 domain-containing protein [Armatimonadota bacterium]MBS1703319.1 DUF433 domain-containing protein [Armatimonadota bacterium]
MIPEELKGVLSQNPNIMSGSICFVGTRIPVKVLLDNYVEGVPLAEFMDAYPDVTLEQIQAVLRWQDRQTRAALGLDQAS